MKIKDLQYSIVNVNNPELDQLHGEGTDDNLRGLFNEQSDIKITFSELMDYHENDFKGIL